MYVRISDMAKRPTIRIQIDTETKSLEFFLGDDDHAVGTWNLDEYSELDAGELERRLGYAILSLGSICSGKVIGNRQYLVERDQRTVLAIQRLKARLANGDKAAIVDLVLEHVVAARRNRDLSLIVDAEAVLRAEVSSANSFAIEYLRTQWPQEKKSAIESVDSSQNPPG